MSKRSGKQKKNRRNAHRFTGTGCSDDKKLQIFRRRWLCVCVCVVVVVIIMVRIERRRNELRWKYGRESERATDTHTER